MAEDGQTNQYICIDLKSFYASVECVERGLDPFKVNLIVADPTRTEKTICLAASPAIKALGVPNRCRVFQIPKDIQYIMAPPRMRLYMETRTYSTVEAPELLQDLCQHWRGILRFWPRLHTMS